MLTQEQKKFRLQIYSPNGQQQPNTNQDEERRRAPSHPGVDREDLDGSGGDGSSTGNGTTSAKIRHDHIRQKTKLNDVKECVSLMIDGTKQYKNGGPGQKNGQEDDHTPNGKKKRKTETNGEEKGKLMSDYGWKKANNERSK
ncbi:hypothetical protein ILUMI_20822 [Ignelater luminosus]|uniref:Uncharacterized protein n=1 Tax=Ignelater luminosus TaxID=2038154 RepID=A0A8K0CDL7_IGNLU|nr:hypothetical protein ILUMI_20822 [Ignelater luminosus]